MSALVERVGNRVTVRGATTAQSARHYAGRVIGRGEQLARGKRAAHDPMKLTTFSYAVRPTTTDLPASSTCPVHGKSCSTWATLGANG